MTSSSERFKSPKAIAQVNLKLQALSQRFMGLIEQGHFAEALTVSQQAQRLAPDHPRVIGDQALCYLRLRQFELARAMYRKACTLAPLDVNLWDGLTEACGHLGLMKEVREHGLRALTLKDEQTREGVKFALPNAHPPPMSGDASRYVIAFSLFGSNPRYCETALLNVAQARVVLPLWTCRFYVDDSVPQDVLTRLAGAGAQLVRVSDADQQALSGLMWRFLVMDDPAVDRFLVRDADSLISTREAAAVEAWVASGQWFHLMRDYFSHTELLLAGMWGGCAGVFPNLREAMAAFVSQGQYLGARVVDQHFLRACVWPTLRQSVLSHDGVFGFLEGVDFPSHAAHGLGENFHVGANLATNRISCAFAGADGQTVKWRLLNSEGQEVCAYLATLQAGAFDCLLPGPYVERITAEDWKLEVIPESGVGHL
jgi:hypothetical protein